MREKTVSKARRQFSFESYKVKIGVRAESETILEEIENRIAETLPGGVKIIEPSEVGHILEVERKRAGEFKIYKDGEMVASGGKDGAAAGDETLHNFLNSQIRLTIAEYAVGKVFLHAGAVARNGKALIIPASSFAGKSSLVAALIKKGALYYSDEYAVLDEDGLVSPFPKTLSLRGIVSDYEQVERSPESLGGVAGKKPVPVGLVLICKYDRRIKNQRKFAPEILSSGQGTLEILAHAIPARFNPKFTLETLCKITSRAIIARCKRGEADEFAELLIDFLDSITES